MFSVTGGIDDHGSKAREQSTGAQHCYLLLLYVMWTLICLVVLCHVNLFFILVVMWTTLCLHVNLSCVCWSQFKLVFLYHLSGSCLPSIAFMVQYKQTRVQLYHPVLFVSGVAIPLLFGSCYSSFWFLLYLFFTWYYYYYICKLVFSVFIRNTKRTWKATTQP